MELSGTVATQWNSLHSLMKCVGRCEKGKLKPRLPSSATHVCPFWAKMLNVVSDVWKFWNKYALNFPL